MNRHELDVPRIEMHERSRAMTRGLRSRNIQLFLKPVSVLLQRMFRIGGHIDSMNIRIGVQHSLQPFLQLPDELRRSPQFSSLRNERLVL